jgi:hypothetical protein
MLRSVLLSLAALTFGVASASAQAIPTQSQWEGPDHSVLKILTIDGSATYHGVFINYAPVCFGSTFDVIGHNTRHGVALQGTSPSCPTAIRWWGRFPTNTFTTQMTWLAAPPVRGIVSYVRR